MYNDAQSVTSKMIACTALGISLIAASLPVRAASTHTDSTLKRVPVSGSILMCDATVTENTETNSSTSPTTTDTTTPTLEDRKQYRATHFPWAVMENPEQVGELIKSGEDVNATDEDGRTALHFAVREDHYAMAKLLLDNGAKVNVKEHSSDWAGYGWYPLHLALRNENTEMVQLLVDRGADVNAARTDKWTPLFTAAYHGQNTMQYEFSWHMEQTSTIAASTDPHLFTLLSVRGRSQPHRYWRIVVLTSTL